MAQQNSFHDFMTKFMPMLVQMENEKKRNEMWLMRQLEGQKHQGGIQSGLEDKRLQNAIMKMLVEQLLAGAETRLPAMQGKAGLASLQEHMPGAIPPGVNIPPDIGGELAQSQDSITTALAQILSEEPEMSPEGINAALGAGGQDFINTLLSQLKGDIGAGKDRDVTMAGTESRERASERATELAYGQLEEKGKHREYLEGIAKTKGKEETEGDKSNIQKEMDAIDNAVEALKKLYPKEKESTLRKWAEAAAAKLKK